MLFYGSKGAVTDNVLDATGILGGNFFIYSKGGQHIGKNGVAFI